MGIAKAIIFLISNIFKGKFSLVFNAIARRCPARLFRYNKAQLMRSELFDFNKAPNPLWNIKIAEKSDIDDIVRITSMDRDKIKYLLDSGVTCFLASNGESPPLSVAWNTFGKCYIRGMGLEYDFGDTGAYGFWSVTLPEARGKGLHYALMAAKAKYAREQGASHLYSMIEFDNEVSYNIRLKTGYKPVLEIYYMRLFCFNFSRVVDLENSGSKFRLFYNQPQENVTII